jgi:hypothetical protein
VSEQYPSKAEGEPTDAEPKPAPDYAEPKPAPDYAEPKPAPDYAEPKPAPAAVEQGDDEPEKESEVTETIESRIEEVKQKAHELLDDKR